MPDNGGRIVPTNGANPPGRKSRISSCPTDKEKRMSKMSADDIRASLKDAKSSADGTSVTIGQAELDGLVRSLDKKEGSIKNLWRYLSGAAVLIVVLFALMFVSSSVANEASKEMHVENGDLVTLDGKVVETVEAVRYTTLGELAHMTPEFISALDKVTYKRNGFIETAQVGLSIWGGAGKLELYGTAGDEVIKINGVNDVKVHRGDEVYDISAAEKGSNDARRTLLKVAGMSHKGVHARTYTLDELRQASKILEEHELMPGRGLGVSGDDLAGIYYFLGGIASSTHVDSDDDTAPPACLCGDLATMDYPVNKEGTVAVWNVQNHNEDGSTQAGKWYLDFTDPFENPRLRIDTIDSTNNVLVQEFHGTTEYSYQITDYDGLAAAIDAEGCPEDATLEGLASEDSAMAGMSSTERCAHYKSEYLLKTMEEVQTLSVQNNEDQRVCSRTITEHSQSPFTDSSVCPLGTDGTGRAIVEVGGFHLLLDGSNEPVEIGHASSDLTCGVNADFSSSWEKMATIQQISSLEAADADATFPGCDDSNTGRKRNLGTTPRKLGLTAFMAWISNTNWCGGGTDNTNTVCPSSSAPGSTGSGYDLTADRACRRHDHGAKHQAISVAVKLGCDIDKDLADATNNWCAQGIFGRWGIAQAWGCFDYGSYSCWNWKSKWWGGYWRYGGYCRGEYSKYGPWRYDSISHNYGYVAKHKPGGGGRNPVDGSCPGDLSPGPNW